MSGQLLTERRGSDNELMLITLHSTDGRNTLSPQMYTAGIELLNTAERDPAVRAVVIHGSGGMFCAGGNLQRLAENRHKDSSHQFASIEQLHSWIEAIRLIPKPVVAAVEGAAAGAGCSLALACDFIIAAEQAKFVMAYVNVGLSPDGGATWQLARSLPRALAAQALMQGKPLMAEQLQQHGLVNEVVPQGKALDHALQLAAELAQKASNAIASIKELMNAAQGQSLNEQLAAERDQFVRNLFHDNAREGIEAFLAKRAPRFAQQ
jgi:enoyl-CoA hydratase/carnithine racemase